MTRAIAKGFIALNNVLFIIILVAGTVGIVVLLNELANRPEGLNSVGAFFSVSGLFIGSIVLGIILCGAVALLGAIFQEAERQTKILEESALGVAPRRPYERREPTI